MHIIAASQDGFTSSGRYNYAFARVVLKIFAQEAPPNVG